MAESSPASANSTDGRYVFKYEKESYTLVDILNKFSLPIVVLASEDDSLVPAKFPLSNVKARQPMLLYKLQIAMGHYEAKPLLKQDGKLQEIGDTLKIPDNYDGNVLFTNGITTWYIE